MRKPFKRRKIVERDEMVQTAFIRPRIHDMYYMILLLLLIFALPVGKNRARGEIGPILSATNNTAQSLKFEADRKHLHFL